MKKDQSGLLFLDILLQKWRIRKALPFIPERVKLLDIGCLDGVLFEMLKHELDYGVGIDPLVFPDKTEKYSLIQGFFPKDLEGKVSGKFHVITMLAVLEHIPQEALPDFTAALNRFLELNGLVIITVPDPKVDRILAILQFLRLVKTMSFEEHYGYDIRQTIPLFEKVGFECIRHKKFQLGLNNLFVFRKTGEV